MFIKHRIAECCAPLSLRKVLRSMGFGDAWQRQRLWHMIFDIAMVNSTDLVPCCGFHGFHAPMCRVAGALGRYSSVGKSSCSKYLPQTANFVRCTTAMHWRRRRRSTVILRKLVRRELAAPLPKRRTFHHSTSIQRQENGHLLTMTNSEYIP